MCELFSVVDVTVVFRVKDKYVYVSFNQKLNEIEFSIQLFNGEQHFVHITLSTKIEASKEEIMLNR